MKFSVTIPAYKKRFLTEAIESVLSQTYSDFELIIVDDNSPEDLKSIIDKFSDPRIRYFRNKKNCGAIDVVDNWNICLSYCIGEYVICMGDDDKLLPCCLEEYNKLIDSHPDLDVYHAWSEIIDENSIVYGIQEARPEWESAYSLIWHRWNCRKHQFIGDFLYKVDHLRQNGGYYKIPLAWGSDDITAVRAALNHGIANTQKTCFQYRFNRLSITGSGNCIQKAESVLLEKKWFEDLLMLIPDEKQDVLYHSLLCIQLSDRYKKKIKGIIFEDLRNSPGRIFIWMKNKSKMGLSYMNLVSIFMSVLKVKIIMTIK